MSDGAMCHYCRRYTCRCHWPEDALRLVRAYEAELRDYSDTVQGLRAKLARIEAEAANLNTKETP